MVMPLLAIIRFKKTARASVVKHIIRFLSEGPSVLPTMSP